MTRRLKYGLTALLLSAIFLLSGCKKKDASAPTYPVTIVNESSHDVCSIKFFLAGSYHLPTKNLLRESLFRTRKLASGQTATVYVPQGFYDVRVVTCDDWGSGEDDFLVPPKDKWIVSDDMLTRIVR